MGQAGTAGQLSWQAPSKHIVSPAAQVVLGALPLTGWVFRDAYELEAVEEERDAPGWSSDVVAWCLSEEAARRAERAGWYRPEPRLRRRRA